MHKLAKGLKKKKKQKKGKKGTEEDEFNPEELERYRRERAEAQQKLAEESTEGNASASDEWRKFEALTAGVDSILKKSQGDLDRIKSTSFFQRKPPPEEKKPDNKETEETKNQSKKYIGFDKDGNPIEEIKEEKVVNEINEDGFVNVPDDDDEQEDSSEEDIFDTTYIDVLQNTEVQLAYIPESPTEEEAGDDPFDTTNAEKVLKTVDKKGKKLVSLGNAVEVLAGRIDYVSTCKLQSTEAKKPQDLLLGDDIFSDSETIINNTSEPIEVNKTLLDDDTDIQDLPEVDITNLPTIVPIVCSNEEKNTDTKTEIPLDISEFEIFKESTILEEIPDLDDTEFDLTATDEVIILQEAEDPFSSKEAVTTEFQHEIVEASFEVATFVNEEDPFDTAFAENILPGKTELKFIEKELEELPESITPIINNQKQKTELLNTTFSSLEVARNNLLDTSSTDLNQLPDEPIKPSEELTYVDPFDTSGVQELPPGKTELKFLEKELLGEPTNTQSLDDDDFDPRKDEVIVIDNTPSSRKTSRPEVLEVSQQKAVAFEIPTPSSRPDLLSTSKDEKVLPSKPLTPYYCQRSFEETFETDAEQEVDPFDTSFVVKVAPSKVELKLIENELLEAENQFENTKQISTEEVLSHYTKTTEKKTIVKQESLLDSEITVDIKPLTPCIETKKVEEEISYSDPFDTSIASSILPGKAELKLLENELSQVPEPRFVPLNLAQVSSSITNFHEAKESTDFLCLDANDPGHKVLTPLQENQLFAAEEEDIDPFDTSFASVGLGKTEIKLLESELINK